MTEAARAELASRLRLALVPLIRRLRQHNGPDLPAGQASALASISRNGPITVGDLAELEGVSSPMITKIAKNLEQAGLVDRTTDPADRRSTRLELTAEGRERLEGNRVRKNAWLAARLAELGDQELRALEAAIPVLERVAADDPARLPAGRAAS